MAEIATYESMLLEEDFREKNGSAGSSSSGEIPAFKKKADLAYDLLNEAINIQEDKDKLNLSPASLEVAESYQAFRTEYKTWGDAQSLDATYLAE